MNNNISLEAITTAQDVLAKCAAYDPWFPKSAQATVLAWAEEIDATTHTSDDLLAAVTAIYCTHGAGFKPLIADIINAARAIRQERREREDTEIEDARVAAKMKQIADELAATKAIPQMDRYHDETGPIRYSRPDPAKTRLLQVACPHCHAGIGQRCYNAATKRPLQARAHPARIEAASFSGPPPKDQADVVVADRVCACGRPLLDDNPACDRCQPHIDGHQRQQSNGDRGTA